MKDIRLKFGLIAQLAAGSLILCLFAFYNKYPLVYSDTGTYIYSGFSDFFPNDRPIFYGLFIRHMSLKASLFLVVFMQGMMVSYSIFCFIKFVCVYKNPEKLHLIICLLLSVTTGLSVVVSDLIPDVFTGVCFLNIFILLFGSNIKFIDKLLLSVFFVFSLVVHLSHFLIFFIFIVPVILHFLFSKKLSLYSFKPVRLFLVVGLYCVSVGVYTLTHYAYDKKFWNPEAGAVFKISKLLEIGIMQDFLRNNCSDNQYSLCSYVDKPEFLYGFMWDPISPANLNGGWIAHQEEFEKIIDDIMSNPKYQRIYWSKALEGSFVQLFNFEIADITKSDAEGAPLPFIQKLFPQDLHQYYGTRQIRGTLTFNILNFIQYITISLSSLLLLLAFKLDLLLENSRKAIKSGIWMLILFFIFNAFCCSTFSIVASRFQMRIIWLIPLFLCWVLANVDYKKVKKYFEPAP